MNVEQINVKIYNSLLGETACGSTWCRIKWVAMILLQELFKKKFKAVFKVIYNKQYRKDILKLCRILSRKPLTSQRAIMMLKDIEFSHEINYPKWVEHLSNQFRENPKSFKPIKVFYLEDEDRYVVIDGNHRLMAAKEVFEPNMSVPIKLLTYKG